jgi:hypothetical protein
LQIGDWVGEGKGARGFVGRLDGMIDRRRQYVIDTVSRAVANEREHWQAVLAQVIAHQRDVLAGSLAEFSKADRQEMQRLRSELHDTKVEVAKLTSLLATIREERARERGAVVDLPALPTRGLN